MGRISHILLFVFSSIFCFFLSCENSSQNNSEKNDNELKSTNGKLQRVISCDETIYEFYSNYITALNEQPSASNDARIKKIKNKFLTRKLIDKLRSVELDYDPLINAQDVNIDWINSMEVKKESTEDQFTICYLSTFIGSKKCIRLEVVTENGTCLINNVVLDENLDADIDYNSFNGTYYYYKDAPEGTDVRNGISYTINIADSDIVISKESYSRSYQYICMSLQKADTLELLYDSTIEGYSFDGIRDSSLMKIYKEDDRYFAKSPLIMMLGDSIAEIELEKIK